MSSAKSAPTVLQIAGRIVLSLGLTLVSALAAVQQYQKTHSASIRPTPEKTVHTDPQKERMAIAPQQETTPAPPAPLAANIVPDNAAAPVPPPIAKPKRVRKHIYFYNDGEYIGTAYDIFYGVVQVGATIKDGWIVDIKWLRDPEDLDLDRQINHDAMPKLTREAIKVQNAAVDLISGASFTVLGFRASLASALAQADKKAEPP